ncbi:MAG: DUF480 domain-containing protein, partial [Gammaproteobacteria bacterium]
AVLCLLLLRGPQTPGEIRTRSARLHAFENVHQTEQVLVALASRSDGPYLVELAREPGRRENRYMHLFCGEPAALHTAPAAPGISATPVESASPANAGEIAELRERLGAVETELERLKSKVQSLLRPESDGPSRP